MAATKLKARFKKDVVTVKALMNHPMETGLRKDKKTGIVIPAHYISDVLVESNGETVFSADWTASVSQNPFLFIKFYGSAGDTVKLTWKDNKGNSDSLEKTVGKK